METFFPENKFLKWITFTGGEPFLRNDLSEIVGSASRHCPDLYLINTPTNSLSPDKILEAVERILHLGIPEYVLSISLDGPPEVHDRIRGIPGAWDKAMEALKGAKKIQRSFPSGFNVVLEYTLLSESYGRFNEMVEAVRQYVPDIHAGDFILATANVSEHYYGNISGIRTLKKREDSHLIESALIQVQSARKKEGKLSPRYIIPQLYLNMAIPYMRTNVPLMRCRATRSTIFIDPDGAVYPCNAWNKILGYLRKADYSLKGILDHQAMKQIHKDMDQFKCGGCWTPCEAVVSLSEEIIHPRTILRMLGVLFYTK